MPQPAATLRARLQKLLRFVFVVTTTPAFWWLCDARSTGTAALPCEVDFVAVSPLAASAVTNGVTTFTAQVVFDQNSSSNCELPALDQQIVSWTALTPPQVQLSANGNTATVTALGSGVSQITATYGNKSARATLTITPQLVGSVTLSLGQPGPLQIGFPYNVSGVVRDVLGAVTTEYTTTWTSSNPTIATVAGGGPPGVSPLATIFGIAPGTVTITATAGGVSGSIGVTIAPPQVAQLRITGPVSVDMARTIQLIAIAEDNRGNVLTDRQITWTSDAPAIATVSTPGSPVTVTGVTAGRATITATSEGRTATHVVNVLPTTVVSVQVLPATNTIRDGRSTPLTAVPFDQNGNVVPGLIITWSTTNANVVSVQASGPGSAVATAVGEGTADVRATIAGVTDLAQVTVLPDRIAYGVANQPQAISYSAANAYNAGGPIRIVRQSTGRYTVTIPSQRRLAGESEILLVSRYGTGNTFCGLDTWALAANDDMVAQVHCSDLGALPADGMFSIMLVGDGALEGRMAFGVADREQLTTSYDAASSYNSAPGTPRPPVRITRMGVGDYAVTFTGNAGGASEPEAIQITTISNAGARCTVGEIMLGEIVRVRCYRGNATQPPLDSKFAILLADRGRTGERSAIAYAGDAAFDEFEGPGVHPLPGTHARSSAGGGVVLTRTASEGLYEVVFQGLAPAGATLDLGVQVLSRDTDDAKYCSVVSWARANNDLVVNVQCFTYTGSPEDESFYLLIVR